MWQNRLNGVLGLWIIAMAFLEFSVSLHQILLVLTGITITLVAFWGNYLIKPTKDLVKESREASERLRETEKLKLTLDLSNNESGGTNEKEKENKKKPKVLEVKKIVASFDEINEDGTDNNGNKPEN